MTRMEFLKQEIENTKGKILNIIEGAYNSGRISNREEFKWDIKDIKSYMFMINELEKEIENEKYKEVEFY